VRVERSRECVQYDADSGNSTATLSLTPWCAGKVQRGRLGENASYRSDRSSERHGNWVPNANADPNSNATLGYKQRQKIFLSSELTLYKISELLSGVGGFLKA